MSDSPGQSPASRRIRIFISSTFRDMIAERDELMTQTWPQLRKLCQERHVELVEVDLRWGIAEEQSTRKETLKLCLDEIRACRPFFIGLLGERYGWTPPGDAFTADLQEEQPWLVDLKGKSVTELEILHGVLNNPEMADRAFFYFRDPAYAESRGPDFHSETETDADKQTALKAEIRVACKARNIRLRETYPDPGALVELVLADLTAAINAQYPKEEVPDALTREAQGHEAFAEIRRRTYIGRPDYFATLDQHAAGSGGPLVLVGDSGGGKSALLANWIARWRVAHSRDFIFQHYIGGTADSADHWRLMTRLLAEIKRWTDDPEVVPTKHEDMLRDCSLWLNKARMKAQRDGVRFILVLDALNQLDDHDHARLLGWLPEDPCTGPLRVIVSSLPGKPGTDDPLAIARQRRWEELRVQPLTVEERGRMITDYLARFGKKLDNHRLRRLASAPAAANPLYLKILLDDLRVTGTHDKLDERLDGYLQAADIPALLQQVLTRYQRDYERDRTGLVAETLGLIYAARRGLSETELLQLLRPADQPQLPLALWTPLRAALEDSLVDRGGILNFAHDFLRTAVETSFVADDDKRDELRVRLADYFEQEPVSERSCDELPWVLRQARQRDRLRSCILDIPHFLRIHRRDEYELMGYWVWLGEERTMCDAYVQAVELWVDEPARECAQIAGAVHAVAAFLLMGDFIPSAERLFRKALSLARHSPDQDSEFISQCLRDLASAIPLQQRHKECEALILEAVKADETRLGPDHPMLARDLRVLGQVYQVQGRLREAYQAFTRALKIDERHYGPDHDKVGTDLTFMALMLADSAPDKEAMLRRALAISEKQYGEHHVELVKPLNNLAYVLSGTGRVRDAGPLQSRALAIAERFYPPYSTDLALILNNHARYLQYTHRLPEAIAMMRRSIAIFETVPAFRTRVVNGLNNLALMVRQTGDLREAQALLARAIQIGEGEPGGELDVARSLNNLSKVMRSKWHFREAEALSIRAVRTYDAYRASSGFEHQQAEDARSNLSINRMAAEITRLIWVIALGWLV